MSRQIRSIRRLRRRHRRHGGGLHETGGMGQRAGDADRLQLIFVVERACERADGGAPVDGLVGDFDGGHAAGGFRRVRSARRRTDRNGSWRDRPRRLAASGRQGNAFREGEARRASIKASKAATSGAKPDDSTNAWGSSARILSITVRRVSTVVPWRAKTAPS